MEDEVLDVEDLVRLEDFVREVPDVEYLVDLVRSSSRPRSQSLSR